MMEYDHDDDLFIRPDGKPMVFIVGSNRAEKQKIKLLIDTGGGVVVDQNNVDNNPMVKDHGIMLISVKEIPLKKDMDMFVTKYIYDCVTENRIIENMSDYRFRSHLPSVYVQYDPLDILLGSMTWSQVKRKDEGEKVSDIEDDDDDVSLIQGPSTAMASRLKTCRIAYSKKEQQCIVDWIVQHKAYKQVKGNVVWQQMESQGVGRGRTWQSIKEHFRKQIITQIHTYRGLTWRQIHRFRAAFGMDQEPEDSTTSEEDEVEELPLPQTISSTPRKKNYNDKSIVGRNLLETNVEVIKNIEENTTRISSKVNKTYNVETSLNTNNPNNKAGQLANVDYCENQPSKTGTEGPRDVWKDIRNLHVPNNGEKIIDVVLDVADDSELAKILEEQENADSLNVKSTSRKKRRLYSKEKRLLNIDTESSGYFGPSPVIKNPRRKLTNINEKEDQSNIEIQAKSQVIRKTSDMKDTTNALQNVVSNSELNIIVADNVPANTEEFEAGLKGIVCSISESQNSSEDLTGCVTSTQKERNTEETDGNRAEGQVIEDVAADCSIASLESRNLLEDDYPRNSCLDKSGVVIEDTPSQELLAVTKVNSDDIRRHHVEVDDSLNNELSNSVIDRSQSPPKKKFKSKRSSTSIDPEIVLSQKLVPENQSFSAVISDICQLPLNITNSNTSSESVPDHEQKTFNSSPYDSSSSVGNYKSPPTSTLRKVTVNIPRLSGQRLELAVSKLKNSQYSNIRTNFGSSRSKRLSLGKGLVCIPNDQEPSRKYKSVGNDIEGELLSKRKVSVDTSPNTTLDSPSTNCSLENNISSTESEVSSNNIPQEVNQSDEINMFKDDDPQPGTSKNVHVERNVRQRLNKDRNLFSRNQINSPDEHSPPNTNNRPQLDKYKEKWRTSYSKEEDAILINYLLEHGGYGTCGGNVIWKLMENSGVCPGRTWHSMRERFNKNLKKRLNDFQVTKAMLVDADKDAQLHNRDDDPTTISEQEMNISMPDSSSNVPACQNNELSIISTYGGVKRPYQIAEDLKILAFIGDNKRFGDTGGKEMWETMEKRNVVPGRSWQSMKERYRKTILRRLEKGGNYPSISKKERTLFLRKS